MEVDTKGNQTTFAHSRPQASGAATGPGVGPGEAPGRGRSDPGRPDAPTAQPSPHPLGRPRPRRVRRPAVPGDTRPGPAPRPWPAPGRRRQRPRAGPTEAKTRRPGGAHGPAEASDARVGPHGRRVGRGARRRGSPSLEGALSAGRRTRGSGTDAWRDPCRRPSGLPDRPEPRARYAVGGGGEALVGAGFALGVAAKTRSDAAAGAWAVGTGERDGRRSAAPDGALSGRYGRFRLLDAGRLGRGVGGLPSCEVPVEGPRGGRVARPRGGLRGPRLSGRERTS